jgi:peptidoglycan/xylan/chitin deacetylase (PgdA/CDA1 family)
LNVIPVLGYHSISDERRDGTLRWSVSPGDFDEQMALLRQRGCSPLTVSGYADLLRRKVALPPRPVLVTFDDGYADLVTTALPILRRYGIAATGYVITSRVGVRPSLHWDEIRELRAAGIEIGSHSHTHRPLDCLRADLPRETGLSRRILEDRLGDAVLSFAYPYGYHSTAVRRAVRQAGFTSACAVKNAFSHPGDDPFAIARVLVQRDTGNAGIDELLDGRGWPIAWTGERLRTRGWRAYRRTRYALDGVRKRAQRNSS